MLFKRYFLVGGAGFIGSHFIDALLSQPHIQQVTIYDNFSTGKTWHYQHHTYDPRLTIVNSDAKDIEQLTQAMRHHDIAIHLASNSDIAKAVSDPTIDFTNGFYLTYHVLEAMRLNKIKRIIYTSGSGVYGDVGTLESHEDQGPMHPISTYGASKLAGEAYISSYCHMFGLTACIFRFGNVVGPRQTHGVGYDFVRNLLKDPTTLRIMGNGTQSKSYIHIDDIIKAVFLTNEKLETRYEVYNVATGDYITVRDIANIVIQCLNIRNPVNLIFSETDRGWAGDVPIVRLNTNKIRSLGWRCQRNSAQAIKESVLAMIEQVKSLPTSLLQREEFRDHAQS